MTQYPDEHGNGWKEWSKYVLKELERLNECGKTIEKQQQKLAISVAMLQVKAGVWGLLAGALPALITWFIKKGG